MNKSDLLTLIKHPGELNKSRLDALKGIASDFPYYQGIHALITKTLANEKHYEFDKYLKRAALAVPDRNVLYRYIQGPPPLAPVHEPVKEPFPVIESIQADDLPPPPVPEPVIPAVREEIPPVLNEPEELTEDPVVENSPDIQDRDPAPEHLVPIPVMKEPAPAETELHSFLEWLQLSKEGMPTPEEAPTPVMEEPDETGTIIEQAPFIDRKDLFLLPTQPPAEPKITSNNPDLESVLDKFIRESPSISRPKAEFYNPANMARQSAEEDEDLVTETLANVYYKQGHYKKAVRAYEKLCLIYPHKMAYFADLIQKIKQEIKD